MSETPTTKHDIYADESSQTGNRFLVIGGVIAESIDVPFIVSKLITARQQQLPHGEMKWGKVSESKYRAYQAVVDAFFEAHQQGKIHFHALIGDTSKHDHRRFNGGSKEVGFSKEIYQILIKFGRLYTRGIFYVYLDDRTTKQSLDELRLILNRGIRKYHKRGDWPYRRVTFRNSKQTQMIQLADILLGALAFKMNGHDRKPNASPAKVRLANHILARARIYDIAEGTGARAPFSVWHRRYKKGVPQL